MAKSDSSGGGHGELIRVAVVGPCASGKSTLAKRLTAAGYEARQPAQEHSYVPDMWLRLTKPDILIYLDVSFESYLRRSGHVFVKPQRLVDQRHRLRHARENCDLHLDTSELTADQVAVEVLAFLGN